MDRKLIRSSKAFVVAAIAATLALPATAEVFVVTLNNGNSIETARQPEQASWDPGTILVLSEVGNWIGIPKSQIKLVEEKSQIHGFGHRIDNTTIALGDAPNDLPEPPTSTDPNALYAAALEKANAQREATEHYSVKQGVSTEDSGGGIPLTALGLGTFPVAPAPTPPPSAPQGNSGGGNGGGGNGSGSPNN